MKKIYLKFVLATVVVLSALLFAVPSVAANAASMKGVSLANCQHLLVDLHGAAPATGSCLDKQVKSLLQANPHIVPNLGFVDCGSHTHALILWFDSNFSGGTICFENAGSTDMSEWNCPAPHLFCNWNDNASSYQAGCSAGNFYLDAGEQGQRQGFSANQRNNFDGLSGRLPNDSLSSLTLNTNC